MMEGDPEIKIQPRAPTTEIRCQPESESESGRMGFSTYPLVIWTSPSSNINMQLIHLIPRYSRNVLKGRDLTT